MRRITILLFAALLIIRCEKEQFNNGHSDLLVVEGYLFSGRNVDSIRLSNAVIFNGSDTVFHGIPDASISISSNGNVYNLLPSVKTGYYYCPDNNLKIIAGNTYNLDISYAKQHITAQTTVPATPVGLQISDSIFIVDTTLTQRQLRDSSLLVQWKNPNKDYYFVILENKDTALVPIIVTNSFNRFGNNGAINFARRFQTRPTQDSLYRVSLFSTIGNYGHYVFKLYKVSKDYASLYQSRGQSSINLNEPFTNISNGLGIFTSFSVCDSLFFRVNKLQ
jgi:hypothetical protein